MENGEKDMMDIYWLLEDFFANSGGLLTIVIVIFAFIIIRRAIKIVPQSQIFVIERFGKFTKSLKPGLSIIIPFLDQVAHVVSILERQLPQFEISAITKDNVEVKLECTVFYRVTDPSRTVYRIENVDAAVNTTATSIVRSAAGKLDLDDLQSSRDSMNDEISTNLQQAAEIWGIDITRTEILDVIIDSQTQASQRQQLNAERERRAAVAQAEGEKRSIELSAEAKLFEAKREAEAVRITADADAYAVKVKAEADAEQTRLLAEAIANNGQPAIDFEVVKRQVDAIGRIASSDSSKTILLPSEVTGVLGGLETLMSSVMRPNMASPVAGSKGTKVATKKVLEASKPEEISNTAKTRKASKTISTSSDDSVWKM
jgi:regulator of protease activity HflC (stomatin/prohibitin superfamily)